MDIVIVVTLSLIVIVLAFLIYLLGGYIADRLHARQQGRNRHAPTTTSLDATRYSEFSRLPTVDDSEYDPLAEAEIYLTYGNKASALETLVQALERYPERDDIALRLAQLQEEAGEKT